MSLEVAPGLAVGIMPLMVFVAALIVIGGLQFVLYPDRARPRAARHFDDPETAGLMAIDQRHMFALAMAIAMAVVAIAGVFLAIRTNFDPSSGPSRLLFAFEAVIIGGLGSLWGTLAGGVILGVAQAIGARIDPGWQLLAGHVAFLLILVVRPSGLFPRMR